MFRKHQQKRELLEEVATIKPGDKVFRWQRKHRGMLHTIRENVSRLFKGTASK